MVRNRQIELAQHALVKLSSGGQFSREELFPTLGKLNYSNGGPRWHSIFIARLMAAGFLKRIGPPTGRPKYAAVDVKKLLGIDVVSFMPKEAVEKFLEQERAKVSSKVEKHDGRSDPRFRAADGKPFPLVSISKESKADRKTVKKVLNGESIKASAYERIVAVLRRQGFGHLVSVTEATFVGQEKGPSKVKELKDRVETLTRKAAPDLSYDPLFRAKLRGRVANRRLLRAAGPLLTEREVARLLRTKIGTVKRRRQKGALLGVDFAGRRGTSKFEYPQFQFVAARVIPGLPEVLRALATHPPWAKLRFLVSENDSLGGARPLDRIRAGDIESVLRSASVFGEQGAA